MSTVAERKIKLALEWLEANPKVYDKVKRKIKEVGESVQFTGRYLAADAKTMKDREKVLKATGDEAAEQIQQTLTDYIPGLQFTENVQERLRKRQIALAKATEGLGRKFRRAGFRVGFYGWIVSYAARSIWRMFSQLLEVFTKVIKVSVDWPTSLTKVATALALLESRGLLTADMETLLRDTMERLLELGPDFEAMWLGLEAIFIAIATIITSKVVPAMSKGLAKLAKFILENEEKIADLAEKFFGEFIPALIDAIPSIMDFIDALMPIIPFFTDLLRKLAPVLPLLLILGTALWILGPILTTIGAAIGSLNWLFGIFAGKSVTTAISTGTLTAGLGSLALGLGKIVALVTTTIAWMWGLKKIYDLVKGALLGTLEPLDDWIDYLEIAVAVFAAVSVPAFAAVAAFFAFKDALEAGWDPLETLIDGIKTMVKLLYVLGFTLRYATGQISDMDAELEQLLKDLEALCFKHVAVDVAEFSQNLDKAIEKTRAMREALYGLKGGLGEVGFPKRRAKEEAMTQYVTVHAPITIENISADVDLDEAFEVISTKISGASRRRSF